MQEKRLKIKGLYTLQNNYSEVPDGALAVADNIVIDRDSVASPRRGFAALTGSFSDSTYRPNQLFEYQSTVLAHYSTNKLAYWTGSAWTAYSGTFAPPDSSNQVRSVQANQNFYFLTSTGVKKLAAYNGTPASAGVPKALGATAALNAGGSFLADTYLVAYRVVWGIIDANKNKIMGAPSQRIVITNSAGATRSVDLVIDVPTGITTSHFVQVYRSATGVTTPSDELYLVYEDFYVSGTTISVTDDTPITLTGAALYTSPSQEGILQANEAPPLAKDVTYFRGHTLYSNTTSKNRYTITMLGVNSGNGVAANDTITIDGVVYTAKASETVASGYFLRTTGGSVAQNIEDTTKSLVKVINQYASNTTVYAYYISGPDDLPGTILLEERGVGSSAFAITVSKTTAWSPDLTGGATSSNDAFQNGIMISKFQQPEAVPILNVFRVGSANDPILRILPLRSSVLIFKQTEGVYRLTGDNINNFQIDLLTSSVQLLARESAVVLNNQVFCLTDQGVVALTENNFQVMSRPIEDQLFNLFGTSLATVKSKTWAVAYESDRKYIIGMVSSSTDTYPTQAFVWNTATDSWTRWVINKQCGFVRPSDGFLYVGDATAARVSAERKTFTFQDHVDEAIATTISAVATKVLTVNVVDGISVGDIAYQSASVYARITAVDTSAFTLTIQYDVGFSTGAISVLKAYTCSLKWVPFTAGDPMIGKQFREATFLFDQDFASGSIVFTSDVSKSDYTLSITGTAGGGFGLLPFGEGPFGGGLPRNYKRTYVPRNNQRAYQLSMEFTQYIGFNRFQLEGVQLIFNSLSEKIIK